MCLGLSFLSPGWKKRKKETRLAWRLYALSILLFLNVERLGGDISLVVDSEDAKPRDFSVYCAFRYDQNEKMLL